MPPPQPLPTFLLTGFEPFGGDAGNPSWDIAARLDGWQVGAPGGPAEAVVDAVVDAPVAGPAAGAAGAHDLPLAVVRSARLPCVFGAALAALDEALVQHRPVAVIALGLAASRAEVSVERVAINIDDARIPDNAGRQPIDRRVYADGPVAYWSSLPIKAIVAAMRRAGIAAAVSQSAGTFVCNHVFYGLAHRLAGSADGQRGVAAGGPGTAAAWTPPRRGGFIHVPWPHPPESAVADRLTLEMLVEAIRIAVLVTLSAGDGDLKMPDGAID